MRDAVRFVLSSVPDAVLVIDSAGSIIFVNALAESLFGCERGGLLGHTVEVLMPELFGGHREGWFELPEVSPMGKPVEAHRLDGPDFPAEISMSPLVLDGMPMAMVAVRDMSERLHSAELMSQRTRELSEANERLRELDRLKSEFLALMSHELRTPLNSVIGFTGLVLDEVPGPLNDEQKRQLTYAHNAGIHLLSLINDLLEVSKIEAGQYSITLEEVRVDAVVRSVIETMQMTAAKKGLALRAEAGDGLTTVVCDRQRLTQVLLNLIGNAVKFTDRGEITVLAERWDDAVLLHVRDTGIGIPEDKLSMLFRPFQQLDTGHGRKFEGTGLGLYMCKKLAALMEGDVWVSSVEGRGSTFTLRLPSRPLPR